MSIWSKVTRWVDADLAASVMPSRSISMFGAVVPFGLGLLGFGLVEPWKETVLFTGIALALGWLLFWAWRAFRYLRSNEFHSRLLAERNSLPANIRDPIFGREINNYNDAKLIAIRNSAAIGMLCLVSFAIYVIATRNGAIIPARAMSILIGVWITGALGFAFCILQLATSPRQDARLIKWLAPGLRSSNSKDIGVQFPDPADENFDVATVRYLAQKIRAR